MRFLVVGNGGREAAIAWKVAQSPLVTEVVITPAHPAATRLSTKIQTTTLAPEALALEGRWDCAIIGPEVLLGAGLADQLRALSVPTVGPSALAARLETSKAFAKSVMEAAGVPTASWKSFTSRPEALAYIASLQSGAVVKVDAPAQGKGVVVANTAAEAARAVEGFFDGHILGHTVAKIVVEERLEGTELSAFALCAGDQLVWLGAARDHKRLRDGDLGPNTGGMGAFAPLPEVDAAEQEHICSKIFLPVLKEMKKRGEPFQGFLFAGLMRTAKGLQVLEFNVRLGDPETQVLLPLLQDDLVPILIAAAGNLLNSQNEIKLRQQCFSLHTVLAAPGYPGTDGQHIQKGQALPWNPFPEEGVIVFPAGLDGAGTEGVTYGGRILGVTAIASSLEKAHVLSLKHIEALAFAGSHWRTDIGRSL